MIVEQLIDDADSPPTTLEWSLCLPGVGFRISLTAKTPRITPIGAQKRKRSLSFATRSNKLSDPRTIIPLTNTHTHTPAEIVRPSSPPPPSLLQLPPPHCAGRAENETFTSFVYFGGRAEDDATPASHTHTELDHGQSPWCPVWLSSIATLYPVPAPSSLPPIATDGCPYLRPL